MYHAPGWPGQRDRLDIAVGGERRRLRTRLLSPQLSYITDNAGLGPDTTLQNFPLGVVRKIGASKATAPRWLWGFGLNSSLLNTLVGSNKIAARASV